MTFATTIDLKPDYKISRVIRGGWQLAGGHGTIDRDAAIRDLIACYDAGIFTFDCADIYTGVEELIGAFRARLAAERGIDALKQMKVHTKLVPDLSTLPQISKQTILSIIEQSLLRLRVDCLDLVQFHWWDYSIPGFLGAFHWLDEIRREGKIRHIGSTNFDTPHIKAVIEAGIPVLSMEVQYSVLDARPENGLAQLCLEHGIALLCYGSVAGGFLGERWLGACEPEWPLENRSLVKYKLIIDDFGGWALFQELLKILDTIARRERIDIATVAGRYVLAKPAVAAIIVGARNPSHIVSNARLAQVGLSDADIRDIDEVTVRRTGPAGDTYTLERDRTGRHGSIMLYNLNAKAS